MSLMAVALSACGAGETQKGTIPIMSWAGIPCEKSEEAFKVMKESGIDWHLDFYADVVSARKALDAAAAAGVGLIPGIPELKTDTEAVVAALKDHPALVAWHIKDEPEVWDIDWIADLRDRIADLDGSHPSYINLYPNWAWGNEKYAGHIELFASKVNTPFYSFDQYPVTEEDDGTIAIRPGWYRNLEEFSAMAKRHGKPFWAFALALSHHLGAPSPEAFYPVPTLGHLRLQVFSDLLYGAQVIQYFTFGGLYDVKNSCKTEAYDAIRQVNSEIKAYSPVFLGCDVKGVWHTGETIPEGTLRLQGMLDSKVLGVEMTGDGAVVSMIENSGRKYIAVQNRDCVNSAVLSISFKGKARRILPDGTVRFREGDIPLAPGDMAIFQL
ncbi:MAG: hypothetical protein NC308_05095 [Clostridium sp.]|nr:hypothetical protein [Bacteroides sp.]MCM1198245.1 hypothetical protein [Clostridium sp.]